MKVTFEIISNSKGNPTDVLKIVGETEFEKEYLKKKNFITRMYSGEPILELGEDIG